MSRDFDAQLQREQLHRAAQDGDRARANELLERRYPINGFDDIEMTPLHYAVQENHVHIVDPLLQAGANVNAHDERRIGNAPLREYARTCSYAMAKKLIDAGADPTIRGWMQMNARDAAADRTDGDARKVQCPLEDAAERRVGSTRR